MSSTHNNGRETFAMRLWAVAVALAVFNAAAATRTALSSHSLSKYARAAEHAHAWMSVTPSPDGKLLIVLPRRCGPDDEFEFRIKQRIYPIRPRVAYMPDALNIAPKYARVLAFTDSQTAISAMGQTLRSDGNVSLIAITQDRAPTSTSIGDGR